MSNEQFKVEFIGVDKLSKIIDKITTNLIALDQFGQSAVPTIKKINKELNNTAGASRYATALGKIAANMQKISQMPQITMPSVGTLATDIANVNASLQQTLQTLQQIKQMRTVNINVNQQQPRGGSGSGGGGTGGGSGTAMPKTPKPDRTFEHMLHTFNSLTFAVGTATIAFQNFYALIERGNEVTRAQATLLALISTQALSAQKTTQLYSDALAVAVQNQMKFGGTLAENVDNLLKVQQMARAYGVSVREVNDALQLLTLRDPVQGIQGATIALQELLSGDPMSLRRRFELPADEVNALAKQTGNASLQISGLTELLRTQGIEASVLSARLNNLTATYRNFEVAQNNATDALGQWLAMKAQGPTDQMAESLAYASLGWAGMAFATAEATQGIGTYLSNIHPLLGALGQFAGEQAANMRSGIDLTNQLTEEQKILYEEYVRQGIIHNDVVKARLDAEEAFVRLSMAQQRRAALESIELARQQREAFAKIYAGDFSQGIQDSTMATKQSIESRRVELHTMAAAKLAMTDYDQAVRIFSMSLNVSTNDAREYIDAQMLMNQLTEEGINQLYGLEEALSDTSKAYRDLIASMINSNEQQQRSSYLNALLAQNMQIVFEQVANNNSALYTLGYTAQETLLPLNLLLKNSELIAQAMGISKEEVDNLIRSFYNLQNIDFAKIRNQMDGIYRAGTEGLNMLGQADREMFRAYQGAANVPAAISENVDKELKKRNGVVKDNNDRMIELSKKAHEDLIEFDKESYRKRIRELQAFYADMVTTLQKNQYEMTANDLDLVEGRNSKLDDKERQRLLARENIEAYSRLQLVNAANKANELALGGQAGFAKEYLNIEKERIDATEQLNWKLHDTQVRLEGDPEAQQRAQQVYDKALGELNTYYDTRVGLAQAAANQEKEEERAQRKQIIQDAIDGVMALTDVDETKRKSIVEGLEIAKTTITDLSNVYVDKIDAMRGSLVLLAAAMASVKENASILTPEQLNMFNSLGGTNIGGGGGGGGDVSVSTTTVNVGGITVQVTTQADPNEIARVVLDVLQKQQNQRGVP